jgi:tRNA A37 N6-isopentenylltransferase MiaA
VRAKYSVNKKTKPTKITETRKNNHQRIERLVGICKNSTLQHSTYQKKLRLTNAGLKLGALCKIKHLHKIIQRRNFAAKQDRIWGNVVGNTVQDEVKNPIARQKFLRRIESVCAGVVIGL